MCVIGNFLSLPAFVIGEKDEAAAVELLEQDSAQAWLAFFADSCQAHGVGFVESSIASLLEPALKLQMRLSCQIFALQPRLRVFLAQITYVHVFDFAPSSMRGQ